MDTITTIVVAVLGSTALSALVQFFVTRHDTRKNIGEKLKLLEKDGLRTQLILLIILRPDEEREILTLAEKYFGKLHGNWVATPIFNRWCEERNLNPEWFDRGDE